MTHEKLQQLVGSLAKTVENNQRLATPILAAKLAKCVAAYPHDQTIGMMARVFDKMADNNTLFIRKSEFKEMYNKFYSRGTKFGELFQDELGEAPAEPSVTTMTRDEATNVNPYTVGDQVLANALQSVFDKHLPVKMYSQPVADKAIKSVGSTLTAWNLQPTNLTVSDGNEKFIVVQADYETPKGVTSFYVPVEVRGEKVVEASVFMGNKGPQDLNHSNIKSYLTTQAGSKLKVDGPSILGVLNKAASEQREVSDAELAVTRLNAVRQGKSEFFQNQVVGQKIAEAAQKDVELPKYDEFESFEKKFTTTRGHAEWTFGADKVATARNHIARELASFGHGNPQVAVTGSDEHTIFYGVSLDAGRVAFTVPVKVADGKLQKPTLMLCNGSVTTFDKEGVNTLYVNNETDYKVAAAASPLSALKPSEVINNLKQAIAEGNHAKAEDALNVLANAGDTKAYATAFQIYMHGLAGHKQAETKCSMIVKSSVSEHPICGHTGLPVHRVYQDKHGNCQPLYRKGMDETYEGASFINSKIFG